MWTETMCALATVADVALIVTGVSIALLWAFNKFL